MARRVKRGDPAVAVAYLRVSTDRQELGPEAQRAAIEAWAARAGARVVAWHCDVGVSGGADLEQRPELLRALDALAAHAAGVLVVAKRDRLARDVVIAGTIERTAAKTGAAVASADGAGNGAEPADVLMRTMLDGFAQYERALIRARTRAALRAKRARGERAGNVPFGYRADASGRLEPHDGEQDTIARARALSDGGVSIRGVVAQLAIEGSTGRTGRPLALTQVARLLRAGR